MLPHKTQNELCKTAEAMADAARRTIKPLFRSHNLFPENKDISGFDPVTLADREAELAMRQVLSQYRPMDGIVGEEYGNVTGSSGLTWVLDPIDGTRSFISGTPTWGVLIALSDQNGPLLGVIDQPFIGERFIGGFGRASYVGPYGASDLGTRNTTDLAAATLFTTFPEIGTKQEAAGFRAVAQKVRLVRYGLDCYAYALVALGQIDLVIEAGLKAYDIQAPIALIEAAGGIVTDWRGLPVHNGGQVIAAANSFCHAAALTTLRPFVGQD